MKNNAPVVVLLVALAVVALVLLVMFRPVDPPVSSEGPVVSVPPGDSPEVVVDPKEVVAEKPNQPTRESVPAEMPTSAPKPGDVGVAVFKGRCVDANGAPLAGVSVAFRGRTGNQQRLEAHRKVHGEVQWTDPQPLDPFKQRRVRGSAPR